MHVITTEYKEGTCRSRVRVLPESVQSMSVIIPRSVEVSVGGLGVSISCTDTRDADNSPPAIALLRSVLGSRRDGVMAEGIVGRKEKRHNKAPALACTDCKTVCALRRLEDYNADEGRNSCSANKMRKKNSSRARVCLYSAPAPPCL